MTRTTPRVRRAAVLGGLTLALGAAATGTAGAAAAAPAPAPVKSFDVCYPKAKKCATAKKLKLRAHGTITFARQYPRGKVIAYNKLGGTAYFYATVYTRNGTHNTQSHAFTKKLERGFGYPASSAFITKITVKVCKGAGAKAKCSVTQTIKNPGVR
jgi:hypothetical protein